MIPSQEIRAHARDSAVPESTIERDYAQNWFLKSLYDVFPKIILKGGTGIRKAYAREHGTRSGKPMHRPKKDVDIGKIRKMREMGASQKFIASMLGVSRTTIKKRLIENDLE